MLNARDRSPSGSLAGRGPDVSITTGANPGGAREKPGPYRQTAAFVVSAFLSHIYGTMGLARRLQNEGYRVEYWGETTIRRLIESQGFAYFPLEPIWACYEKLRSALDEKAPRGPRQVYRAFAALRTRKHQLEASIVAFEQSLDRQLERTSPALVLLDPMAVAYYPLLRNRNLKCIALQDKPLPTADPLVPPPTSTLVPRPTLAGRTQVHASWLWRRLTDSLASVGEASLSKAGAYSTHDLVRAICHRGTPRVRRTHVHRRVPYDLCFDGLEEWVLATPELDFPRLRPLPGNIRYVGPWVDIARRQAIPPLPHLTGCRERIVYASMGVTVPTWDADVGLLRRIIAALGGRPGIRLIISAGSLQACRALRSAYDNVDVFPFLPQLRVLAMADVALTHAGANAFRECVATRTPMFALPREFDQPGIAARVVYHGLGVRGARRWETEESIRRKVSMLLDDGRFSSRIARCSEVASQSQEPLIASALQSVALLS